MKQLKALPLGLRFAAGFYLLALLMYLLALLMYLLVCTASLLMDNSRRSNGTLAQQQLALAEFEMVGALPLEEENGRQRFVSTDSDPQLVYTRPDGASFYAGVVRFAAESDKPGGEMVLYYTTKPGEGFRDTKRVWAKQAADGSWQFDLGGRKVYALRLDPDSVADGVVWSVDAIALNAPKAAPAYFVPDALIAALLLFAPAVLAALVWEAGGALRWRFARRNKSDTSGGA